MRKQLLAAALGPIVVCGSLALGAAPRAAASTPAGVHRPARPAGSGSAAAGSAQPAPSGSAGAALPSTSAPADAAAAPVVVPTLGALSPGGQELAAGVTRPPAKVGFRQAVDRALQRYPSAIVADAEIDRAEALVRQARATSLPTLSGVATYTRLDSDRTSNGVVVASANQLYAGATLGVPLVVPQRWMSWSRASDNVDVARASAADVRRQLGVATGRAWLAVAAQRRIVEVSSRARDTAKAHADFSQLQLDGGVGNRIDAVRAKQELAAAEAQLEAGKVGLAKAQEALGVLLGEAGPSDTTAEAALPAPPPSVAAGLDESGSRRTDVLLAQTRLAAADASERAGWADFVPYLTGSFQMFLQDPASIQNPPAGWQAQLSLTVPLYDGGLRYGQADERAALLAEAEATLAGVERQARSDVRAAFEAVRRAEAAARAAREAARLAEEARDLATQAYLAGASTNIEVIDAERRARDAQTAAVIADDNAQQARLDLLAATGRFP